MSIRGHMHTYSLGSIRARLHGSATPWVLSLLLLAQGLVPLQSHTRLAVNEAGIVVAVCTLEGIVEQTLQLEIDQQPAPAAPDSAPNPAMLFSQIMAEAMLALDAEQPAWLALKVSEPPPAVVGTPVRRPHRLASIRAPPSLV